jgi:hypothetical protein
MSKKSRQRDRSSVIKRETGETRSADGLTVAWMMTVMTTVVCGVVGGGIVLATRGNPAAEQAGMFGALLHFSAFVAAVVSLVLLAAVLKFRQQTPPAAITWFSVIAAIVVIASTFLY